jgi:hypothetical protein
VCGGEDGKLCLKLLHMLAREILLERAAAERRGRKQGVGSEQQCNPPRGWAVALRIGQPSKGLGSSTENRGNPPRGWGVALRIRVTLQGVGEYR